MSAASLVAQVTQQFIDHADELTALDQAIGDGDHGINMRRGALAIQARAADVADMPLPAALKTVGMLCIATIGGASGPVFGTLLMTLAKELPDTPTAPDLARALHAAIAAITRLGKAEVGQKTLLDVLAPVQQLLAAGGDDLLARTRQCAIDSANATAHLDALRGRAAFLGERAMGHVDPGARSVALAITAICDTLAAHESAHDSAHDSAYDSAHEISPEPSA